MLGDKAFEVPCNNFYKHWDSAALVSTRPFTVIVPISGKNIPIFFSHRDCNLFQLCIIKVVKTGVKNKMQGETFDNVKMKSFSVQG